VDGTTPAESAGLTAYARQDWPAAYEALRGTREQLSADEWYVLSDAAWWLGRLDEAIEAGEQAYRRYVEAGQPRRAAMAGLAVALYLLMTGDDVLGSGWLARCARLLDDEPEGPEHGYLLYLAGVLGSIDQVVPADEQAMQVLLTRAREVQQLGRTHADPSLVTAGSLAEGRVLLKAGRVVDGTAVLDEVLVDLRSGEVSPDWAGDLYCQLMAAASEVGDLRRLRRLSDETSRWLDRLPKAVVYRGICRVHLAQVHLASGRWSRAEQEATRAAVELERPLPGVAAEAHYLLGEVARLRGQFGEAEASYRDAHRMGRDPQPGLALLRLAEGRIHAARRSIEAALLAASGDRLAGARLCAALVEAATALADGDVARQASDELDATASAYASPVLLAMAEHARGLTLVGEDRRDEALPVLRRACRSWQDLDVPYECARVRSVLGRIYQAIGDTDAAALEFAEATAVFEYLGAHAALREIATVQGERPRPATLTAREVEVLDQLARGLSNRQIAAALVISEKTVARHLSNVFTKLGVTSRTAAAAFAVEQGLTSRQRG
jgi:DNA-binding CsgD family transcriptional regulator